MSFAIRIWGDMVTGSAAGHGHLVDRLLGLGACRRQRHLHRGDLVLGAVGGPVGVLGGDDVGAG